MAAESEDAPIVIPVDPADCPIRIDAYLAKSIESFSRSRLQQLIKDGDVLVNGSIAKPSLKLEGGEVIEIRLPPPAEAVPKPEDIPLNILYEDGDLLVINKPVGMVVHPGAGVESGTLVNALLHHCADLSGIGGVIRPGIVHRLDRLTSGCICVAKNDFAHQRLAAQLADRTMSRSYLAWVMGEMPAREGRINLPIGRSFRNPTQMAVVSRGGRAAATRWEVLARAPGLTRVLCKLETGRTHQIRVHFAHVNHPIVGDPEYGLPVKEAKQLIPPKYPAIIQAIARATHQLLHAWRLEFIHPRTQKTMEFEAPIPNDFAEFDSSILPLVDK